MKVKFAHITSLILIILVLFGAYYVIAGISAVTLSSPADGTISSSNDIAFTCSGTPDGIEAMRNISVGLNDTGNATNQIILNDTNTTLISNSSTLTVLNIPDGRYVWNCLAANNSAIMIRNGSTFITASPNANGTVGANFSRSANRTLTVDTAQPDIINLSTKENASNNYILLNSDFTNGSTNLVFSVHDRMSATSTCNVSVNGVVRVLNTVVNSTGTSLNTSANTANNSISVLGFNSGVANNWSVVCSDNAGNTNSTNVTSVNITVRDLVLPVLNGIDQRLRFKGTVNGEQNVEGIKFDFGSPVSILGCNGTDNIDYFRTNATVYIQRPGASQFAIERNDTGGISNFEFTDTSALGLYVANCTIRDISGNQNSTVKNFEIIRSVRKTNFFATTDGFRQPISTGSRRDFGELSTDSVKTRVSEGGAFLFQIDGETHEVLVDEIKGDTITVIVKSEPITATIKEGESKSFDVNNDGTNDIEVNLVDITSSNRADINFVRVSTSAPKQDTTEPTQPTRPSTPIITKEEAGSLLKILVVVFVILLIIYFFIRIKKGGSNKLQFNKRDLGAYRDTTLQLYYK